MPAYLIAQIDVRDPDQYREYTLHTPRVIAAHGGRMLVRNGERVVLEGPADTRRVIVVEFPTLDEAKRFFASPGYQAVKVLRDGAAAAQIIAIDGLPAETWSASVAASDKLSL